MKNKELIGKTLEVLIENQNEDGTYMGVTDSGKNVVISEDVSIATYYMAKVEKIVGNKLIATIIK